MWYNEQGKNSDHNKTSLFQVESMGGQLLANYQQELEIKVPLLYEGFLSDCAQQKGFQFESCRELEP